MGLFHVKQFNSYMTIYNLQMQHVFACFQAIINSDYKKWFLYPSIYQTGIQRIFYLFPRCSFILSTYTWITQEVSSVENALIKLCNHVSYPNQRCSQPSTILWFDQNNNIWWVQTLISPLCISFRNFENTLLFVLIISS
jgi:predicted ATP-binding protein involved in virulence